MGPSRAGRGAPADRAETSDSGLSPLLSVPGPSAYPLTFANAPWAFLTTTHGAGFETSFLPGAPPLTPLGVSPQDSGMIDWGGTGALVPVFWAPGRGGRVGDCGAWCPACSSRAPVGTQSCWVLGVCPMSPFRLRIIADVAPRPPPPPRNACALPPPPNQCLSSSCPAHELLPSWVQQHANRGATCARGAHHFTSLASLPAELAASRPMPCPSGPSTLTTRSE